MKINYASVRMTIKSDEAGETLAIRFPFIARAARRNPKESPPNPRMRLQ